MPTSNHQDSPHHSLWRGMTERGVEERPRPPESPDSRHRDDENKETLSGNRKYIGLLSTTAVCSIEIEIEFNFIYLLSNNSYCVKWQKIRFESGNNIHYVFQNYWQLFDALSIHVNEISSASLTTLHSLQCIGIAPATTKDLLPFIYSLI